MKDAIYKKKEIKMDIDLGKFLTIKEPEKKYYC